MMTHRTESEQVFEEFCTALQISFARIPTGSQKTPDYDLNLGGNLVVTEVKQCDPNEEDQENWSNAWSNGAASSWSLPGRRVRLKVSQARKQLKARSDGKVPTLLIIYDNGTFGGIDNVDIKTAMFGDETVRCTRGPQNTTSVGQVQPGGGRQLTAECNTTISAIALLHGGKLWRSLSVFHNHYSQNPINPNWFRHNRFRHFGLDPECYEWREM